MGKEGNLMDNQTGNDAWIYNLWSAQTWERIRLENLIAKAHAEAKASGIPTGWQHSLDSVIKEADKKRDVHR